MAGFPYPKLRHPRTINGRQLTSTEIEKIKSNVVELVKRKALISKYPAKPNSSSISNIWEKTLNELKVNKGNLLAIISEERGKLSSEEDKRVWELGQFDSEWLQSLDDLEEVFVSFDVGNLFQELKIMVDHADVFKIIDPYIFDFEKDKDIPDKIEFIIRLAEYLIREFPKNISDKSIEVYCRADRNMMKENVEDKLRSLPKLLRILEHMEVRFFGLTEKNVRNDNSEFGNMARERIHKRFFYASGFLVEVDHGFAHRPLSHDTQKLDLIRKTERIDFVQKAYAPTSSIYDVKFEFRA